MKTAREIIENYDGPDVRIMEVCGTHTHEIFRLGIRKLLPKQVELISGPGCPVCVTPVSFIDEDGKPYGLPLSLASDDDVNWYFHGALEGKKLEAIKAHPEVCLSAITRCAPTVGPKDGSFTLQFKSAIAFGKAEIVTEDAEKIHGLRLICERFLPQHMDAFDQSIARSLSRTAVVRITLTEPPTGKRKQYDKEGVEMKYGRME